MTRVAHAEGGSSGRPLRLKKRPAFLRAATGRKVHAALFTVQAFPRPAGEATTARIGFTVTKKVGGAVERNRIKRRLREAVRVTPDLGVAPTHDYVVVARRSVLETPFKAIVSGLRAVVAKVQAPKQNNQSVRGATAGPGRSGQ